MSSADSLTAGDKIASPGLWRLDDFSAGKREVRRGDLPTVEQLEQLESQIRAEGHAQGYREGAEQAHAELMQIKVLMGDLDRELRRFDRGVANSLVSLALEMARQLVGNSLIRNPEQIADVVKEAMQTLPPFGEHAHLMLHPLDIELVQKHIGEQLAHAKWKLLEDTAIERGGCRISTENMQVDATLPTRWRQMAASLARDERWYSITNDAHDGGSPA